MFSDVSEIKMLKKTIKKRIKRSKKSHSRPVYFWNGIDVLAIIIANFIIVQFYYIFYIFIFDFIIVTIFKPYNHDFSTTISEQNLSYRTSLEWHKDLCNYLLTEPGVNNLCYGDQ